MFDIHRDPTQNSSRAGRFRPTARIGIPINHSRHDNSHYWDQALRQFLRAGGQSLWRRYSDNLHVALAREWLDEPAAERSLKTDLFDEAVSPGLAPLLLEISHEVHGVDISPEVVAAARHQYPTLRSCTADIRQLPYPADHFDIVLSNSTLDHFHSRQEIAQSLRELYRVLKPQGRLLITLDNLANPIIAVRRCLPFQILNRLGLVPYYVGQTLSPKTLKQYLVDAGFEIRSTRVVMHAPRFLAIWACRVLQRSVVGEDLLLSTLRKLEALANWPSCWRTGYYTAALAVKPAVNKRAMLSSRSVDVYTRRPFRMAVPKRQVRPPQAARGMTRYSSAALLAKRLARRLGIVRTGAEVIQVELRDGGWIGLGEGSPLPRYGESIQSATTFLDQAAKLLADAPPDFKLTRQTAAALFTNLPAGQRAARSALDAALHDLVGRRAGLPVWKLLGLKNLGPPTSYTVSLDDPDAMARAAAEVASRFKVIKLKLGGDGLDLERVRAVRRVSALPLRLDANESWEFDEALDLLPQFAALNVELVEQPLPAGHPDAERLRDQSSLPIFSDEECLISEDLPACARRAHGVTIKLSKCGGITEALRCAAVARELGLRTMIGCMIESSLGISAAAHISSLFDHADLDGNLLLDKDPFTGLEFVAGAQLPSNKPGLGVWSMN